MLYMEEVKKERLMRFIRQEKIRKVEQRRLIKKVKILTGILVILLVAISVMI